MPTTHIPVRLPHMQGADTHSVQSSPKRRETSLFHEALDTVNPLQHVPGVSQGYRAITKDKISEGAKFAGHVGLGAAVGGPVGAAIGAGVYLVESIFGAIFGKSGGKADKDLVQLPQAETAPRALAAERAIVPGIMRPVDTTPITDTSPAAAKAASARAPRTGSAPVEMSSDQFTALLTAFGAPSSPEPARTRADEEQQPQRKQQQAPLSEGPMNQGDIAARMAANLDKLEALKRGQAPQ